MPFELTIQNGEFNIVADVLFYIGNFPITNAFLSGILLTVVVIFIAVAFSLGYKKYGVPGQLQLAFEGGYSMLLDFVEKITGSSVVAKKIISLIATLFIYIGLSNLLPVLPIYDSITYTSQVTGAEVSLLRGHTLELSTTLGIALAMVIGTYIAGSGELGLWGFIKKRLGLGEIADTIKNEMIKSPGGFMLGLVKIVVTLFVALLDIVGDIFKSVSLSLRLLGNIFAGQLLIILVYSFLAILAVPLLIYGIVTGLIQALVFAALTASYFATSMQE